MKEFDENNLVHWPIIVIFVIQIGLLLIMILLFFLGINNTIEVEDFWFAILMGSLGASIALVRKIRNGKIKIRTGSWYYLSHTIMPILYGTIMAGVTYLIFMSQILSGDGGGGLITTNVFPNFIDFGDSTAKDKFISATELISLIDTTRSINTVELIDLIASKSGELNTPPEDLNIMERFMNTRTNTIKDTGKLLIWCFIAGYSEKFISSILNNIESRAIKDENPVNSKD